MKKPLTIIFFIFSFTLMISSIFYIVIGKYDLLSKMQPSESDTRTDDTLPQTTSTAPPPIRYWSEVTQQLIQMEEERTRITDTLSQKSPPIERQLFELPDNHLSTATVESPSAEEKSTPPVEKPTIPMSFQPHLPPLNVPTRWTTVSQHVLRLEQQRQQIVDLLMRHDGTTARNLPLSPVPKKLTIPFFNGTCFQVIRSRLIISTRVLVEQSQPLSLSPF